MIICDLEANGFLYEADTIHVIASFDTRDGWWRFSVQDYSLAAVHELAKYYIRGDNLTVFLNHADHLHFLHQNPICFHNYFGFDKLIIEKLHDWWNPKDEHDSLVLSQLFNPDRGGHGLEAWGERFNVPKPVHEDWSTFSPEMLKRVIEDVRINTLTWMQLMREKQSWEKKGESWDKAIEIEYSIAGIIGRQAQHGVLFDTDTAIDLAIEIYTEIHKLDKILLEQMPKVREVGTEVKNPFKQDGTYNVRVEKWYEDPTCVGGPFTKISYLPPNLNSNPQIKDFLLTQGWVPNEYTPKGAPKLTESSYETIKGDLGVLVAKRATMLHRARMLFNIDKQGKLKGLINLVRSDGRIEAGALTNGTNTGRMRHINIVNIPQPKDDLWPSKRQIRDLFIVPEDKLMMGVDADGLEARCMAHAILPYPGGEEYTKELLDGDIHCLSGDTELLTPRGWLSIDKISKDSKIIQFDPESDQMKFVQVSDYYSYKDIPTRTFAHSQMSVSLNHRQLVYSNRSSKHKTILTSDLSFTNGDLRYRTAGIIEGGERLDPAFIGLWVSIHDDGYITPGGEVRWEFKKQRKIDRLTSLLEELKLPVKITYDKGKGSTRFYLPKPHASQFTSFNIEDFYKADVNSLKVFIQELQYWDGTVRDNGAIVYDSTDEEFVNHISAFASLCGFQSSRVRTYSRTTSYGETRIWRCVFNLKRKPTLSVMSDASYTDTVGDVYCVTVPSGYILTRRNGRTIITGNSVNAAIFGTDRNGAKSPFYALMYGGQIKKLASILGCSNKRAKELFTKFWEQSTALAGFKEAITKYWKRHGSTYIKGIDGRKIITRSEHSLVNAYFQSTGSIIVKLATIYFYQGICNNHIEAHQLIHYHDEFNYELDPRDEDLLRDLAQKSFTRAGEDLNIRVPITGSPIFGKSWTEVH